jgi:hypothetical protein
MAKQAKPIQLVCVETLSIGPKNFDIGDVVGELQDGKIVPTAENVTRGEIEARMNNGLIEAGDSADFKPGGAKNNDDAQPKNDAKKNNASKSADADESSPASTSNATK